MKKLQDQQGRLRKTTMVSMRIHRNPIAKSNLRRKSSVKAEYQEKAQYQKQGTVGAIDYIDKDIFFAQ